MATKIFISFLLTAVAVNLEIAGSWLYTLPILFILADIAIWFGIKELKKNGEI